jgi:hypothetical protein
MAPSLEGHTVLQEPFPKNLLKPSQQVQALSYSDDIVLQKTNHWEHVIQEIPARCDLNGLLREGQKH